MIPPAYYLVLDYGRDGRETVIDWENCSRADIIQIIIRKDYRGKLIEVHEIDREAGTWTDKSDFIANIIFEVGHQDNCLDVLHPDVVDFIHRQKIGVELS